jgi:hypothetical protein
VKKATTQGCYRLFFSFLFFFDVNKVIVSSLILLPNFSFFMFKAKKPMEASLLLSFLFFLLLLFKQCDGSENGQ